MSYKLERNIQNLIRLELSKNGVTSFRNNVGGTKTDSGGWIDFGVGGKGGSDLICITPITITPDMVGQTVGIFTAIEVKNRTRKPTPEQVKFIDFINKNGGLAGVARSPADALKITQRKAKDVKNK